ncbi:MAG: heavy metal translocating P-type ATPase, partial [Pseudomonadota bacterium]
MSAGASADVGCPSGLAPPSAAGAPERLIDPSPFVVARDGAANLDLAVFGAKCAGCIAKIEKAMAGIDGVKAARLNLSTGRLSLSWAPGAVDPRDVVRRLDALGYRAAPFERADQNAAHDEEGRALLRAMGVAGFAMANVMLLSISVWSGGGEMGPGVRGLMHWASAFIAVPAALYAGRPFFSSALAALRAGRANMDVPISLAVFLALTMSVYEFAAGGEHVYFDAAVMLLFFLLIGRYLDHRLRWRARAAARDLLALQATTASRLSADGSLEAIGVGDVAPGDRLVLAPGDRAPVDAVVVEGASDVDMALVTGESAPASVAVGATLHAGVINQSAPLVVEARARVEDSLIAELTRLVEAGEQTKSRYVRLADKAAALYVPVVHTLAFATFAYWFFIVGAGPRTAIMTAVAVLIITCPCALGLAAPAVQVVATGRLFRAGVLVKSGDALERLAQAGAVVFDKTGTLTLGRPALANRDALHANDFADAAALARVSRHPLSRALTAAAGPGAPQAGARETVGAGVEADVDGERRRFGSAAFVGAEAGDGEGMEAWFRRGEKAPVRFAFDDAPRADAPGVVASLRRAGVAVELLSGDRPAAVERVADRLGVTQWRAGVRPQDKAARIEELASAGARPAMVGDGLNDAPSLAGAYVSLSPGTAADASQAAADFVYQGDGLSGVATAFRVSRQARARVLQNFAFAALYNACAVPLAASGHVTPLIA